MYSPNMLKTFQNCPHKYWLKYVEQISVPQKTAFFEKGKKIHALANYYLKGNDITKLEKTLTTEETLIWEKLKNNKYFQKTYVNSEYNLSCKIGEYWIGGRLDAIVKDENSYYILDYKTGTIPPNPEQDLQTIVYMLALSKNLKNKEPKVQIKFVYIDLKNNQNHIIEYTPDKEIEYPKYILSVCDSINKIQQPINKSKKCEFCEYRKICF